MSPQVNVYQILWDIPETLKNEFILGSIDF